MRDTKTLDQINADLQTHPDGCQCPGHMMITIKRLKAAAGEFRANLRREVAKLDDGVKQKQRLEIQRLAQALKHWQDVAATYLLENELLNARMSDRPVTKQIEKALDAAAARQRDRGDG